MAVKSLVFLRDRNWDLNRCKKMRALKSLQKEKSLSIHRGGQIARDFFLNATNQSIMNSSFEKSYHILFWIH